MCGINGLYAYGQRAAPVEPGELIRVRDRMAARGPDGAGAWYSEDRRIGLGHRRLSIIDVSDAASQPMKSADGRRVITFNGEIYNFRAIRERLEAKGYQFCTQSDTEVLLRLYEEKGDAMVGELRGMFTFALWDDERRSLLLARDPYGIKPLYYSDDGETVRFASQVKALISSGKVSTVPDFAGLVGFCLFGSVPEPFTIYRNIRAVPAGSTIWITKDGAQPPKKYFSLAEIYCRAEANQKFMKDDERQAYVANSFLDSVRHHMVADVPVGAFLSAGVDSGALLGLMRECSQGDIQTVTLAFSEFRNSADDEADAAATVARHYGSRHSTRTVSRREFEEDLPLILDAMDQPTVDGINTWFVSKVAHEFGLKVAISGLGGDELLGGYNTFRAVPIAARMLSGPSRVPGAAMMFRKLVLGARKFVPNLPAKLSSLVEFGGTIAGAYFLRRGLFLPDEVDLVLKDREFVREGLASLGPLRFIEDALTPCPKTEFGRVAVLELSLYMRNQLLRDADWASMAHSLEVRVPLVDAHLVEQIAPVTVRMGSGSGKSWLAASPKLPLPDAIVARRKTGFSVPAQDWLQRSGQIASWASVPALANDRCHWSRRWAYELAAG